MARGIDLLEGRDQCRITDVVTIEAQTLVVMQQVRRGIGGGAQPVGTPQRLEHGNRRALAVGARHGNDAATEPTRTRPDQTEAPGHAQHSGKAHIDTDGVLMLETRQPLIQREATRHGIMQGGKLPRSGIQRRE